MEDEITALLKEIDGVGDVKVMITLESGEENIYAQQEKTAEDVQKQSKLYFRLGNLQMLKFQKHNII